MRESIFDYYNRALALGDDKKEIIIEGFSCDVDIVNKKIILLKYLKPRKMSPVVVPNVFDEIGNNALCDCYKLSGIEFGNRINIIHESAFAYLSNISIIDLRKCTNLKSIGKKAFYNTYVNIELNINDSLKIYDDAFGTSRNRVISINGNSYTFEGISFVQYNNVLLNGHLTYINQVKDLGNNWFRVDKDSWKKRAF